MTDKINVNIWDDYYEDRYVPAGKVQTTYAYLETKISDEQAKEVLTLLKEKIETLIDSKSSLKLEIVFHDSAKEYPNLVGTEYEYVLYKRWQLNMTHLTHELREEIVEKLQKGSLTYNQIPLNIYSES